MEEYLTAAEAAQQLNCHIRTIYNYIHHGQIKGVKVVRGYKIKAEDIEKLKNSGIEKGYLKK